MTRIRIAGPALALLMAVAACSDDATDLVGDALTEAEAEALAEALAGTLFQLWDQGPVQAPGPARVSGTLTVDDTFPCEEGGSVDVAGSLTFDIDDETGYGTINYSVTQDHQNCVAESATGIQFTLNGAPNIAATLAIVTEGTAVALDGGLGGSVQWATGEKSGTCTVDVDFDLTGNLVTETIQASVDGSVCGVSIDHDLIVTL